MEFSWYRWVQEVECILSEAVISCIPRDWDEDFISRSWIKALRDKVRDVEVTGWPHAFRVQWDAYKAVGSVEQSYGDIGLLVRISLGSGRFVEGVACLGAKRIYGASYDAIESSPLKGQMSGTANHRLLLYDSHPLDWSTNRHLVPDGRLLAYSAFPRNVHVFFLPSSSALALRSKARAELDNFSVPLFWQLCGHYLFGYDLDLSETTITDVKQGVKGGVNYLLVANVSHDPESPSADDYVEINRERYSGWNNKWMLNYKWA